MARALPGHRPLDSGELRGEGLPARMGVGEAGVGARTADSSPRLSSGLPPTWELRAWSPDELRGWERRAGWAGRGWALLSGCLSPRFTPPPTPPRPPSQWMGCLGMGCRPQGLVGTLKSQPVDGVSSRGRAVPPCGGPSAVLPPQLCTPAKGPS